MAMLKIRIGSVETLVSLEAYEAIYKPKGWKIVEDKVVNELEQTLEEKGITSEKQQNAHIKAKRESSKRHFDDGLIKEE